MRSSRQTELPLEGSIPSGESDLVILGDCDRTVVRLTDRIGWTSELEAIRVTSLEDTLDD